MNENIRKIWNECTNCPAPHYYGEYELLQKFAEKIVTKTLDEVADRSYYKGDIPWSNTLDRKWVELEFGFGELSEWKKKKK